MSVVLPPSKAQQELIIRSILAEHDAYRFEDRCLEAESMADQTYIELSKIMDRIQSKTELSPPQDMLRRKCEMLKKQQLDLEPFIRRNTFAKLELLIGKFQEMVEKSDKENSESSIFWSSFAGSTTSSGLTFSTVISSGSKSSAERVASTSSYSSMSSSSSSSFSTDTFSSSKTAAEIVSSMLESEEFIGELEFPEIVELDKFEELVCADSSTDSILSTDISSSSKSSAKTASSPSSSSEMSSSSSSNSSISTDSTFSTDTSSLSKKPAEIVSSMLESERDIRELESLIEYGGGADPQKVTANLVSEIPFTIGDLELVASVGERILFHRTMIPHFVSDESEWFTSLRACKRVRVEVLLYALENALKAKDQTMIKNCMDHIKIISRELHADRENRFERDCFAGLKTFSLNPKEGIESHLKYIAEVRQAMYKQWNLD